MAPDTPAPHGPEVPVVPWTPARTIAGIAGGICCLLGLLVLGRWLLNPMAFQELSATRATMNVNVAIGLMLLGGTLAVMVSGMPRGRLYIPIRALVAATVVLPLGTLLEYLLGLDLGIDQWLVADPSPHLLHPGRMAPQTAVTFLMLSGALFLASLSHHRAALASQALTVVAATVTVITLLGYLLRAPAVGGLAFATTMAVGTAIGLTIAALGVFLLRPHEGLAAITTRPGTSGHVVRLLLATVWIATPALAFMRLEGQHRGLYGTEFGLALFALSQLLLLTAIILGTGQILARVDRKRESAEQGRERLLTELQASNARLERTVEERTAALDASRARTEFILNHTPALIGYIDPDLRYQFCNATYAAWFGIDPASWVGRNVREILGEATFAGLEGHFAKALAGQTTRYERTVDGPTPRNIYVELMPDVAPDGRVAGIFVGGSDITERKQAEAARERTEALLATVTNTSSACIGYVDSDLRFRFCNATYRDWYGLEPEELLGRSVAAVVGETAYDLVRDRYAAALTGSRTSYERRLESGDRTRDILVTLLPDPASGGVCIYSIDISDRVRSERELRASEERFQRVARGTLDGIWDWDIATGECYYSPRYLEMLGYASDIPDHGRAFFESLLHPDDRQRTLSALQAHFDQRVPYEVEYRLRTKSGEYLWFHARGHAHWNAAGEPTRFTGAVRDVTARRLIEEQLDQSGELLRRTEVSARIGGWELEIASSTLRWTEGIYLIHDLEPGTAPDLAHALDYYPPEVRPVIEQAVREAIEHGTRYDLELPFVTAAGNRLWVRAQGFPTRVDGVTVKLQGTLQDITDRRQAVEDLAANRKLLADLIDAIPVPLTVKDEAHRFVIVNRAMAELHGRTTAEIVGRVDADIHPPEQVRRYLDEDDEVLHTGVPLVTEQSFRSWNSTDYWIAKHKHRVELPDGRRWIINVLLDLTERRQVELALERNQQFLQAVIEAIPQSAYVKDANHRWVLFNERFCQDMGQDREQLLGRSDPDFLPAAVARGNWEEDDAAMVSAGPIVVEREHPVPRGADLWLLKSKKGILTADGSRFVVGISTDITRLKEVERELRDNAARLRSLNELSSDWVWEQDEHFRFTYQSDSVARSVGLTSTSIIGKTRWELDYHNMTPDLWAEHRRILDAHLPFHDLELSRESVDGLRHVSVSGAPIYDDTGRFRGYRGVGRDITAHKQAELALKRSEAFLSGILDALPQSVFVKDAEHRWVLVNDEFCALLERDRSELLGRSDPDFLPPDAVARVWAEDDAVMASSHTVVVEEDNFARLHAPPRHLLKTKRRVDLPDGSYLVGMSVDITRLKEAQAALEQSETQLRLLAEHSNDLIFQVNPQGIVEYASPASVHLLGIDPDAMVGRSAASFIHPEDVATMQSDFSAVVIAGATDRVCMCRAQRADGEWRWLETSFRAVREPGREWTSHVIGVARDADERTRIERMKNEFVSTVSHELRTPLTSIRGSLGLIAGGAVGAVPEQVGKLVQIAHDNSERLMRLINDILDIEKIESGRMHFELRAHALPTLIAQALTTNAPYGEQWGVRFDTTGSMPEVEVLADGDRFMQIMANLLSNAAKYSPRGSVVSVAAVHIGTMIRISVHDRGPGIPEAFRSQIFGKFRQADSSDSRRKGGTGLGLSIAKALVEMHGGEIGFESAPTTGTTFHFTLSLLQDGSALSHAAA